MLLSLLASAASSGSAGSPDSWSSIAETYGPAALPIFGLLIALRVVWQERNAERARSDDLTERMLKQQETLLPLTKEMVDVLRTIERKR